jgi:ribosomal protein S18 acetylase RimI-like enzyme
MFRNPFCRQVQDATMNTHPLDNPIWSTLDSRHRDLAQAAGEVLRYPAPIAPFLGVARPQADVAAALLSLVARDETVFLLGPEQQVPAGWRLDNLGMLAQMICPERIRGAGAAEIIELGEAHRADVLALTALVYPHYFRPQTTALGRYFGIYSDGHLAAMIGERMGTHQHREISAVCTHPDFNGRGYARTLLAFLANDLLDRGLQPFLHVSPRNERALSLYLRNGFHIRNEIAFWSLQRAST